MFMKVIWADVAVYRSLLVCDEMLRKALNNTRHLNKALATKQQLASSAASISSASGGGRQRARPVQIDEARGTCSRGCARTLNRGSASRPGQHALADVAASPGIVPTFDAQPPRLGSSSRGHDARGTPATQMEPDRARYIKTIQCPAQSDSEREPKTSSALRLR